MTRERAQSLPDMCLGWSPRMKFGAHQGGQLHSHRSVSHVTAGAHMG